MGAMMLYRIAHDAGDDPTWLPTIGNAFAAGDS
jgi:hypothetical protein